MISCGNEKVPQSGIINLYGDPTLHRSFATSALGISTNFDSVGKIRPAAAAAARTRTGSSSKGQKCAQGSHPSSQKVVKMVSKGRLESVRSHPRSGIGAAYVDYGGTEPQTEHRGSRQVNMWRMELGMEWRQTGGRHRGNLGSLPSWHSHAQSRRGSRQLESVA